MTPSQKRHENNANRLMVEAAEAIDATKTGKSPKAAALITKANVQLQKAGLIKGKLIK